MLLSSIGYLYRPHNTKLLNFQKPSETASIQPKVYATSLLFELEDARCLMLGDINVCHEFFFLKF